MRFYLKILLGLLPIITIAQNIKTDSLQPQVYFSSPEALKNAGVKWVNCIFKDSRNLMWFGTSNGLFRFDGTNVLYAHHKIDDPQTIPDNEIYTVSEDKQGNIWVGTNKGGVMMDANTFACKRLTDNNGYTPGWKMKFITDPQNNIWGISDDGLHKYDLQKKVLVPVWPQKTLGDWGAQVIVSVASYNRDELVAGTINDVVFINKHNFSHRRVPLTAGNKNITVSKVYVDADGELWAGSWGFGLFHYNKASQKFTPVQLQKNIPANTYYIVNDILKTAINGHYFLYIGGSGALLKIPLMQDGITPVNGSQEYYVNHAGTDGSIGLGGVTALYPDEAGSLWVGGDGENGVCKVALAEPLFTTVPAEHNGLVTSFNKLQIGGKNYYSVCSWHGKTGVVLLNENLKQVKAFKHIPEDGGDDAANVSSISKDAMGRLWVSSWKGVTVMDQNFNVLKRLDHTTKGPDTLYREKNNYALISNDTVWVAIYKRGVDLFSTNFKRLKHYSVNDNNGLREDLIWKFYRCANGTVWLMGNAFIYRYDAGKDRFIPYFFSKDSASYTPVGMAEKKDGSLLVATALGLVHFNPATANYSYIHSPLLDKEDYVNTVGTDEDDNAWYLTDAHLVHYNFSSGIFTMYGKQDGLDVADGLLTLHYLGNNKLLIGQTNKIVQFTAPASAKKIIPPGLLITGLYVNDSLLSGLSTFGKLTLQHDQNRINIAFACINYAKPEQNVYAYRLRNTDTTWAYTRQGSVAYASLAPGHYIFEVKAANYAFMWSSIKTIYINIRPPFWQAWWFYVICALLCAGTVYSIFLIKINQLKAKQELLNKIARDLHDDIGSSLSGLGIYSRMALENIATDKEDSKMLLQKISERCETVMDALSDIVWSVNTRNDAMDVILTKMREYTAEMLEPQKIEYTLTVDEKAAKTKIGIKIRKEFYLVYKEAINNASKYAKCTHVCVTISYVAKKLCLTVADNGEGFTVGEQQKGNGLINMSERAKRMRGNLTVTSKKQEGTVIKLLIPLPRFREKPQPQNTILLMPVVYYGYKNFSI